MNYIAEYAVKHPEKSAKTIAQELVLNVNHVRQTLWEAGVPAKRSLLTERQTEYLSLLANGYTYQEIADKFVISPKTVASVLHGARERLGANTTAHAVVLAWVRAIIEIINDDIYRGVMKDALKQGVMTDLAYKQLYVAEHMVVEKTYPMRVECQYCKGDGLVRNYGSIANADDLAPCQVCGGDFHNNTGRGWVPNTDLGTLTDALNATAIWTFRTFGEGTVARIDHVIVTDPDTRLAIWTAVAKWLGWKEEA